MTKPATLGQLKESGYRTKPIRDELRDNLMTKLRAGEQVFTGIIGYDDTVIPAVENAILAGHDLIFLGERGQAKSRIMRDLTKLLDAEVPAIAGCEINDDPFDPICSCVQAAGRRAIRRDTDQVAHVRGALRGEARHAGHLRRRPGGRGRPDQGRRRPLPRGRAHDPLRAHPPDESRRLRDQRAARPRRAHPGRAAQPPRGARHPDPRVQGPPAARHDPLCVGEPGGLHEPRPDHHAAEGPLRRPDPHALPLHDRRRGRDRRAGVPSARGGGSRSGSRAT